MLNRCEILRVCGSYCDWQGQPDGRFATLAIMPNEDGR